MTAYSPDQGYPGSMPAPGIQPPPIFVAVAEPVPQRRLTVFFRSFMLIPHLFVLYFVGLAAGFVAFIGWWAALFTGRLPQFAVTFLSGWLRWSTRVTAYHLLLTDVYPPFAFDDDPGYPVRVAIPPPQRLNRAAVFFRGILAFPAALLLWVVAVGGTTLMGFVAWVITLVAGQLPPSFFLAYVALLRFQARYTGYYYMLTPAYPAGLYGDSPGTVSWADELTAGQAPGFGLPGPAYGGLADRPPQGYGAPQGYGSPQGYGPPPAYGTP